MKFLKKSIYIIMAILFILALGTVEAKASSDLLLKDLNFKVQILQDGSMEVTEIWNIDIEDTNTLYKTFKQDKTKYSQISDVTVSEVNDGDKTTLTKTNTWAYHLPKNRYFGGINEDGKFEISWGVGLDSGSARKQYEIYYKVEDAIAKHADYAELYWQFIGADFEVPANRVSGTIYLPEEAKNQEDIKVWGHIESLNGEIYATDLDTISFHVDGYNPGKYLEIRTLFPTNMITSATRGNNQEILGKVIAEETKWADEANAKRDREKATEIIILIAIILVSLGITILFIKKYMKYQKEIKEMPAKFRPTQEMSYYRDIPREKATPAQAKYVIREMTGDFSDAELGNIFSATLLDLSLKKFIEFQVDNNKRDKEAITIKLLKETTAGIEDLEDQKLIYQYILNAAKSVGERNAISMKQLLKYIRNYPSKIVKLKNKIDECTKNILYQKNIISKIEMEKFASYKVKNISYIMPLIFICIFSIQMLIFNPYILIGLIPLIIMCIINIFAIRKILKMINVYTQQGIDEAEMWRGLKRYMEDFSMLDKREVPELVIWEKYLVYATAFGIADKVLKQLKIVYPNIEETINLGTYSYMYFMMNTNFSSSFSSAISTSISTSYSSGTGGGGGFSGGGGGGRWPEEAEAEDNLGGSGSEATLVSFWGQVCP